MSVDATTSSVATLHQGLEPQAKNPLKSATEEFEGMFISYLLKVMRSTVDTEDGGGGELSMGKDLYTDMFDNEIALSIARTRGLGIGEMMYRQLEDSGQAARGEHLDQRISLIPQALSTENSVILSPSPDSSSTQLENVASAMSMPVQGRLTSDFGFRRDPLTGGSEFHDGIDIAAPAGTPFKAASQGTVVFAGTLRGYGNTVVLEHASGERTLYAHASQVLVQAGDEVKAGQTIGLVGMTGRSTGPHLHFEALASGQNIDPKSLIAHEVSRKVDGAIQR